MRARLTFVVATLVLLCPGVSRAQTPSGQIGIRLLEAPASARDDPRAREYIVDHLSQGATITRSIEVSNGTSRRIGLDLYAAGAQVKDGTFRFFDDRRQNELSSWTTVKPAQVSIDAGGTARAVVTLSIPAGAVDGERYAVVWAQTASGGSGDVKTVNRVGIRMYVSVGTGAAPASDFVVDSLTALRTKTGDPAVSAQVRNTGGRALDLSGDLRLSGGPGGLSAGPFAVKLGTTLGIGESEPVLVPMDARIPAGPWDARLVLRSGEIVRAATGRITFPDGAAQSAPAVPAVTSRVSPLHTSWGRIVVPAAGALVLGVAGAAAWLLPRRYRLLRAKR